MPLRRLLLPRQLPIHDDPELAQVQKKGKDRGRPYLGNTPWILVLLGAFIALGWILIREPTPMSLEYGKLMRILQSPDAAVRFRNVKTSRTDIRGDIVTTDQVSDGITTERVEKIRSFRTPRIGLESDAKLPDRLFEGAGGNYQGDEEDPSFYKSASQFMLWFVVLLGIGIGLLLLFRWMSGGNSPLTFGRSRHKLYAQKDLHITFKDVAGIDEAVAEVREIVDFLKSPEKYQSLGGRIPKGVLLVGPPGTGKTLLAKAVAGEADVPFFSLSGSDFVEMFVGVGASRVRDLFAQAENRAPCIIFIDELDALGKTRGGVIGSHDEREQTLNQLLVEMDGFDSNRGVIIMAATNRPETLDAALLRPGRFDRTVVVDRPDIVGREAILKVHVAHVKLGDNVDLRHVASLTPGSVGADLANLVNEAALMAVRNGKDAVSMTEFNEAIERNSVGLERKSRIMNADEKQRVAYHEAGHALVACALPNTHPVHKVSIIPRGVGALGYVLRRPEEDRYLQTQSELESLIKVALAGTVAEELTFREISNGATSDLENANEIARRMVTEFGMSRLGKVCYRDGSAPAFLPGVPWEGDRHYSEQTAREIDLEARQIVQDATDEVRAILAERQKTLEVVAKRLIEKEVIDGPELRQLIEENDPQLRLVPGSRPVDGRTSDPEAMIISDRRAEGDR
jgi:cell division protease FtsH